MTGDFMKIAIIPNSDKEMAVEHAVNIIEYLKKYDTEFNIPLEFASYFNFPDVNYHENQRETIRYSDIVITIGGDGTIIHAAKYAAEFKKPILGVNCGRIGFVANMEPTELNLLDLIFTGKYQIDKRMMLEVTIENGSDIISLYALNDVTVSRGALSRIVELDVNLDEEFINTYRSDGLILSTPTGSTAYSLSAGGPVIEPHMKCILLTPICPHSLFSRSVLFSEKSTVEIKPKQNNAGDIYVSVDGVNFVKLCDESRVTVRKAELTADFIKLDNKNFYRILNDKLNGRRS